MEFQRPLCLFLFLIITFLSTSQANKFNVGGSQGWVPNPSQSYNQWAGSNRFQINDTIVFKYKKGSDSVLEVKKEDYDKCNKTNPIKKFENGDTEFKFDRSGPFYFISGKDGKCEKGQKLIVVVLSPRTSPSPTPPSISPSVSPPTSPSPVPAGGPPSPSVTSPSPSPAATSPSPSPAATSPSPSPAATSPSPSPAAISPSPSPAATSPESSPPAPPPSTVTTPPSLGPSASPTSPSSPLAGPTSPPVATPSSNSTTPPSRGLSVAPSSFLVYSVTIVVGAIMLRY